MAIQLNEPAILAVKERLENNLPAAIDAINAEVTDGHEIEPVVAVHTFIPPPDFLDDFPMIGIGDGPSTFEDDNGSSATGRHELLVVAYLQDAEQEALAWKLRRYLQAIARVVLKDRNLNDTVAGAAWGTGLVRISAGPTLADNEDPKHVKTWMTWAGVQIWVKRDEE